MVFEFIPQFVAPILSGQKGWTLRNERKPEPKINETICMVTGTHAGIISKSHSLKGVEKVRLVIKKKALVYTLLVYINDRPLSQNETLLFCFLSGFNSPDDFCKYWLKGEEKTMLVKYMYRWIELPF